MVADADAVRNAWNTAYEAADTFDDVLVKAWESVSVKVEAEVEADNAAPFTSQALGKYTLKIRGDDENGNPNSGNGSASTISMKVVDKWSATVSTPATKQTVIRKASNAKIAEFTIKPANGASSVDLESIAFDIYGVVPTLADDKITVEVDGIDEDDFNVTGSYTLTYTMNREIKSEGAVVTITLDDETSGTISITNLYVNEKKQTKTFNKMLNMN